jgi:serine/threonine-protein kinase
MIGTYLGPYELRTEIASGGMATVYRADQPAVDREVAVKIVHAAILHDEAMRERFRREALAFYTRDQGLTDDPFAPAVPEPVEVQGRQPTIDERYRR